MISTHGLLDRGVQVAVLLAGDVGVAAHVRVAGRA